MPVPYAWVSIQGGAATISDERGEVNLGAARRKALTVEVRRIGYQPWYGKLQLPDTAVRLFVILPKLSQMLEGITIVGAASKGGLTMTGFYDRWMMRQRGALSATFIGPEEIEKRHVERASDLLYGVLGVNLMRTDRGSIIARNGAGTCFMTILLDGQPLCPAVGCHSMSGNGGQLSEKSQMGPINPLQKQPPTIDQLTVNIDEYINPNDLAAIEIYARGGNMPVQLQAADAACGVIAFWTGPRR